MPFGTDLQAPTGTISRRAQRLAETKRTEVGIAIVAVVVIAGIVARIVLPFDNAKDAELRETRRDLDNAELVEPNADLVEVRADLADAQAELTEVRAVLATVPSAEPIFREVGKWTAT